MFISVCRVSKIGIFWKKMENRDKGRGRFTVCDLRNYQPTIPPAKHPTLQHFTPFQKKYAKKRKDVGKNIIFASFGILYKV